MLTSDLNNFIRNEAEASFLTNYSGPPVGFPCPTTIHMKDTLTTMEKTKETKGQTTWPDCPVTLHHMYK